MSEPTICCPEPILCSEPHEEPTGQGSPTLPDCLCRSKTDTSFPQHSISRCRCVSAKTVPFPYRGVGLCWVKLNCDHNLPKTNNLHKGTRRQIPDHIISPTVQVESLRYRPSVNHLCAHLCTDHGHGFSYCSLCVLFAVCR